MTISAAFTFSGVATPLAKKSVAAATTFTATIDDLSGIASVEWAIIGTDGITAIGDYTAVASGTKGSIYTITSLTAFTGGIVQATVRSGDFVDVKRALFYVPSTGSGLEPLMFNEWFEGDAAAAYVAKMNASTLVFDGAVGFNPQATPQNIATTGGPSITNIGTRAGESVNVGPTSGADTNIRGLVSLDGTGNDVVAQATSWETTAATIYQRASAGDGLTLAASSSVPTAAGVGNASLIADGVASIVGDETTLTGQSGIYVSAAATPPTNETGKVKLKADTAIELTTAAYTATCSGAAAFSSTSYALTTTAGATLNAEPIRLCYRVRVIATGNVANLTTVTTMDGVTLADGDLVLLPSQSTATQNGLYRYTLSTTTLARATAFDNLSEYHLGTQARAYAGTANKGKAYQLTALSSNLPATWEDITGSGGGGGASISDGTGTLGIASAGDLTSTGLDTISIDCTGTAAYLGGNGFGLHAGTNVYVDHDTLAGIQAPTVSLGADAITWPVSGSVDEVAGVGGFGGWLWDASGANIRGRFYDAAGSLSCTDLYDDAACSRTVVGTYTIGSGGTTVNDIVRLRCGSGGGDLISANNQNYVYVTNSQIYFYGGGTQRIQVNGTGISFNGATPVAQATITGNVTTGSLADLQGVVGQLLTFLASRGDIINSTT